MRSLLIGSVPVHGHVSPLLGVARHFAERGDRVRFLTGARFAAAVAATGAEFLALPAEADYDDRQDFNETFPERRALTGIRSASFDVEHLFARPGRPQYDAVLAAHAAEPVDVLLADPMFWGTQFLLGLPRAERPPIVLCGIMPLMMGSRDTAPPGMGVLPMRRPFGTARNWALKQLMLRTVFAPATRLTERMSEEIHGRPMTFAPLDYMREVEAYVQFGVAEFEYPRSDDPPTLHYAGPVLGGGTAPKPPWWGDLDGDRPVVHVTQGTVGNKDFGQLVAPTLDALATEDVLVVVTAGGRPLDSLPPLPPNARAAEYLAYDDLFPRTAVYVTNGGYGGVQHALSHGVPIVVAGAQEDKLEVAARVHWAGVGRRIRSATPSPDQVRRAVRALLDDPRYRTAAARMAGHMAAAPGFTALDEVVDHLVRA
ncbi:glycosyltransferase [Pseudonocardia ailaonensis]|uniref:Glycosyltransferase n=1 Tax=Pseudonocardia ailaonensis TaxID=367279 RepID=A0ABN2MNN6_9PSEU